MDIVPEALKPDVARVTARFNISTGDMESLNRVFGFLEQVSELMRDYNDSSEKTGVESLAQIELDDVPHIWAAWSALSMHCLLCMEAFSNAPVDTC
jgi:hypothetical protein